MQLPAAVTRLATPRPGRQTGPGHQEVLLGEPVINDFSSRQKCRWKEEEPKMTLKRKYNLISSVRKVKVVLLKFTFIKKSQYLTISMSD